MHVTAEPVDRIIYSSMIFRSSLISNCRCGRDRTAFRSFPAPGEKPSSPDQTLSKLPLHGRGQASCDRRGLILTSGTLLLASAAYVPLAILPSPPAAHAEGAPSGQGEQRDRLREAAQEGTPFVLPALAPPQYVQRIVTARPLAWERLQELIDDGFYKKVRRPPSTSFHR